MKKWLLLLAGVIALAVLQLSWPRPLVFFHARPDLLLAFVIAAVFYLDLKNALVLAIICGLLKDSFLPGSFGVNTLLFSAWCYLTWLLGRQISTEHEVMRFAVVLIAAFLNNLVVGAQSVNLGNHIPAIIFLRNLVIPPLYTAALSSPVFKLVRKITA